LEVAARAVADGRVVRRRGGRRAAGTAGYDGRVMVTEIGFVSLLVAGLGALAGGLGYLAMRISRGRW